MQIPHCYPDIINHAAPKDTCFRVLIRIIVKILVNYLPSLFFVVNSLGFEESCVEKFIKFQAAGTSSKLSDSLGNHSNRINNTA